MAKLIPDYIHVDCKSNAERKFFERCRTELPDNYIVLHSLGLAKHAYKLWAEIDFVILHKRGLLCIEVKGGRIKQEKGRWYFTNRYGEVNSKRESPFQQAVSGMYALRRKLWDKFGRNSPQCSGCIGYAVVFTDENFTLDSPEWDLKRLIGKNELDNSLSLPVGRLFDYSETETLRAESRKCSSMTQLQLELLCRYLRPDFEIVPSLSSQINDSYEKIIRLTKEQYIVLDQLEDNDRTVIRGAAGTGKTLLALEKLRRELGRGNRAIFLCHNRFLAQYVRGMMADEVEALRVFEVNTLSGFARKLVSKAKLEKELPQGDDEEIFDILPELFEKAFVELYEEPPFDTLVVDEGQDLKSHHAIRMLDWLILGGLKEGRWTWFEDYQQNIFGQDGDKDNLSDFYPAKCRLATNCRNTKPISMFTSLATDTDKQKCLVDSGLKVEPIFYSSSKHQLKHLENILTRLLGGGVKPEDIVLLSPSIKEKSVLKDQKTLNGFKLLPYGEDSANSKCLRYTTIHKFKGLESKAVIAIDINDLESTHKRSLNYVAFSRATSCLEVLINENAKEQFKRQAYKFAQKD